MKKENSASTSMALQSEEREINKVYHCEKLVENPASGVAFSISSCNKLLRDRKKKRKARNLIALRMIEQAFGSIFPAYFLI